MGSARSATGVLMTTIPSHSARRFEGATHHFHRLVPWGISGMADLTPIYVMFTTSGAGLNLWG